jgi:SAM-dependent methyltransferase
MLKPLIKSALRPAASALRWARNKVDGDARHAWESALPKEVSFWEKWIATRGLQWQDSFRERTDPNWEVDPKIARFIVAPNPKVIDVGAGPVASIGTMLKGKRIEVVAVDPLADEYNRLLAKYKIVPPVVTQKCDAERLTAMFPLNTFDLAYAANCLDHSYDPVLAIQQMLEITKPGGFVVLLHEPNEGEQELYRALHQWNFHTEDGDFLVSSPARQTVNVSTLLASRAKCGVEMDGAWLRFFARKF